MVKGVNTTNIVGWLIIWHYNAHTKTGGREKKKIDRPWILYGKVRKFRIKTDLCAAIEYGTRLSPLIQFLIILEQW